MRATDAVRSALANTVRSRLRTVLTVLAILVGSFTLTLTSGVGAGISRYIDDTLASVGSTTTMEVTRPQGNVTDGPPAYDPDSAQVRGSFGREAQALSEADLAAARALPGVVSVEPTLPVSTAYIQLDGTRQRFASSLGALQGDRALQLAAGRAPSATAAELAVPKPYARTMGLAADEDILGRTVTFGFRDGAGRMRTLDARVTGVLEQSLAPVSMPVASPALVRELYDAQVAGLAAAQLPGTPSATLTFGAGLDDAGIQAIKDGLTARGLSGATTADRLGMFQTVIDLVVAILSAFAVIALLAASFGIVNTLLMSVQERTREIGLLKAHGLRGRGVFALFSLEAVTLGLFGALLGSGLGIAVGSVADRVLTQGTLAGLPGLRAFSVDPGTQAAIVGLVIAVAFVAGTVPAARAARRDPITALRYE